MVKRLPASLQGSLPGETPAVPGDSDRYAGWETWADLIAAVPQAGRVPTESVIRDWARVGVIPHGQQTWPAGHAGSVTLYPQGTGQAVFAAYSAYQRAANPEAIAWLVWRHGFPVADDLIGSIFKTSAHRIDQMRERLLRKTTEDGSSLSELGERRLEKMRQARTKDRIFSQMRKRVGKNWDIFSGVLVSIAGGSFEKWNPTTTDIESVAMAKAIGVPFKGASGRAIAKDLEKVFANISWELGDRKFSEVLSASSLPNLEKARNELRGLTLLALWSMESPEGRKLGHPIGLNTLAKFAVPQSARREVALLLAFVAIKAMPGFQSSVDAILSAFRRTFEAQATPTDIETIRKSDPALCAILFSPPAPA
jgi:hypothetical protein